MTEQPGKIHAAIIAIMRSVGPIAKGQKNVTQNFMYRGVDDVYNACHPQFAEHGVYQTSKILDHHHETTQTQKGTPMTRVLLKMEFTFWAEDGSFVSTQVIGEGMDWGGDKAHNKAMSIASKYALLQLLQIPTAMVDPDKFTSPDVPVDAHGIQPRGSRVSAEDVTGIKQAWKDKYGSGDVEKDRPAFIEWCKKITGRTFNPLTNAAWSADDITKARLALNQLIS